MAHSIIPHRHDNSEYSSHHDKTHHHHHDHDASDETLPLSKHDAEFGKLLLKPSVEDADCTSGPDFFFFLPVALTFSFPKVAERTPEKPVTALRSHLRSPFFYKSTPLRAPPVFCC